MIVEFVSENHHYLAVNHLVVGFFLQLAKKKRKDFFCLHRVNSKICVSFCQTFVRSCGIIIATQYGCYTVLFKWRQSPTDHRIRRIKVWR